MYYKKINNVVYFNITLRIKYASGADNIVYPCHSRLSRWEIGFLGNLYILLFCIMNN